MSYSFDFFSHDFDRDPFPVYKVLRDEYPCYWHSDAKVWMISRFDDIMKCLNSWKVYSSEHGNLMEELPGRAGATLGTTDPPRHDRLRALIQHAFMKRQVEVMEEEVRGICRAQIQRFGGSGSTIDYVLDYSAPISVRSVAKFLGLPLRDDAEAREIREHAVQVVQYDRATGKRGAQHLASFDWIRDYAATVIAERSTSIEDGVIRNLAVAEIDGDKLSEREVLLTVSTLILAGIESVGGFMAVFAYNMASLPEARQHVVNSPERLPPVIEESLRFNSSAQRFYRRLKTDVDLHGQHMAAGDTVCLVYGAGNRDERRFADPDVFDVERNPRAHLGFGGGVHSCIGSAIGRMVTRVAIDEFHRAFPSYSLATEEVEWLPSLNFRSPKSVPIRLA